VALAVAVETVAVAVGVAVCVGVSPGVGVAVAVLVAVAVGVGGRLSFKTAASKTAVSEPAEAAASRVTVAHTAPAGAIAFTDSTVSAPLDVWIPTIDPTGLNPPSLN
jgi:hypothetical protein